MWLKPVLTSSAMTGKNMMIVAVLLANSVKQATKAVINITAAAGGTWAKGWRWPPIQEASPDSCQTPQDWGQGSKITLQHNKTKLNQAEQSSRQRHQTGNRFRSVRFEGFVHFIENNSVRKLIVWWCIKIVAPDLLQRQRLRKDKRPHDGQLLWFSTIIVPNEPIYLWLSINRENKQHTGRWASLSK